MTALGECAWTDRALVGPAVFSAVGGLVKSATPAGETASRQAHNLEKLGSTPRPATRSWRRVGFWATSEMGRGDDGKTLPQRPSSASTAWLVLSELLPDGRWVECERPGSLPDGAHLLAPDFAWEYAGGELARCWMSSAEAERQGRLAT